MAKDTHAVVPLEYPVQLADRLLKTVTMRRPTLQDELDHAPASRDPREGLHEEAGYFAHLCGLPVEELLRMDMADYERLQTQYLLFRGKGAPGKGTADDRGRAQPAGADVPA
ncbi:phage tail assembly protein [Megalodesulfovibrio paquesii]